VAGWVRGALAMITIRLEVANHETINVELARSNQNYLGLDWIMPFQDCSNSKPVRHIQD
jgi:hypothetical protein